MTNRPGTVFTDRPGFDRSWLLSRRKSDSGTFDPYVRLDEDAAVDADAEGDAGRGGADTSQRILSET